MSYNNAGQVLKSFRSHLDITQKEMATRYKIHVQFVSNFERGLCLPPLKAMKKIYKDMSAQEQIRFKRAVSSDLAADYMNKLGVGL